MRIILSAILIFLVLFLFSRENRNLFFLILQLNITKLKFQYIKTRNWNDQNFMKSHLKIPHRKKCLYKLWKQKKYIQWFISHIYTSRIYYLKFTFDLVSCHLNNVCLSQRLFHYLSPFLFFFSFCVQPRYFSSCLRISLNFSAAYPIAIDRCKFFQ